MDEMGVLSIKVKDGSGELMPCRLHLKQRDGSCVTPMDMCDPKYTESEAPDLLLPSHYDRYLHRCQGGQLQSLHLNHGRAQIPVSAGSLTIFLARGHEYVPISDQVEVKSGATVNCEYTLCRRFDLPSLGWYGGDMHTHFSRWEPSDDYVWSRLLLAEDIRAVNNMVYKHAGNVEAPQYAYGSEGEHHTHHHAGHHVIASGEEFRDDDLYGHMIAAGITDVIEPISVGRKLGCRENYPLFASVCDWTHEQGGIAGWAHGGTMIKLFESLPVEAALGKLDFVENIQFNMFYGFMFWYRLLNCGIRLACTGGSGFPFRSAMLAPWYPNLGLDRTYVRVDGEFTYPKWIDGIRHGRTFATNGPLLLMTVDGQPPGTELHLNGADDEVLVEARVASNHALDCLEIVANGAVVKHVEGGGGRTEIACADRIRIDRSTWLAARVRGIVPPENYGGVADWKLHAHTSPIYVLRGDQPVRVTGDLTAMADYVRALMEVYIRGGEFTTVAQREELMMNCEQAINYYEGSLRA